MSTEHEEIEYLSQGVNYLGFLAQELGDLRGITTLANELLQNADDAKNDAGELAATIVTFDITDDAFVITNDAYFRETDFERLQEVASASKRFEGGARTTGAFGIGFISVYQVTDRPEIISSGRHWSLRPEEDERTRIKVRRDDSITSDQGTTIRLPWAFTDSEVRRKLRVQPVNRDSLETFVEDLKTALPRSILFLKNLESIELKRRGETIMTVSRTIQEENLEVIIGEITNSWRVLRGQFNDEATEFRRKYKQYVEENRVGSISLAVPESSIDDGILYATLPTEESTGLPFHIDADFYPRSDRKGIVFGDDLDHRSVWNRLALAAAADALGEQFVEVLSLHKSDHKSLWHLLDRLHKVHNDHQEDDDRPLGAFWEAIADRLKSLPIVFTDAKEWRLGSQVRIAVGQEEESAIPVFSAMGIEMSNTDLTRHSNLLRTPDIGVQLISPRDFLSALETHDLVDTPADLDYLPEGYQSESGVLQFWASMVPMLKRNTSADAKALLARCSLAICVDGRLMPFNEAYRADAATRDLFTDLIPGIPFLIDVDDESVVEALSPAFTADDAIEQLSAFKSEHFEKLWRDGLFDPSGLIKWFQDHSREYIDDDDFCGRLSDLPIFPSGGNLRPLTALAMPGNFTDPLGLSELVDIEILEGLKDYLQSLGAEDLTFVDYVTNHVPNAIDTRDIDPEKKRNLAELLARQIGEMNDDDTIRESLAILPIVECDDGNFRRPEEVYFKTESTSAIFGYQVSYAQSFGSDGVRISDLHRWLGVADYPRANDVIRVIRTLSSMPPENSAKNSVIRIIEALGKEWNRPSENGRERYYELQEIPWLLADGDTDEWYKPGDLFASFNRNLFESQANFLDVPVRVQQEAAAFLGFLGVGLAPATSQVVKHLLECVNDDRDPPEGIYNHLNNNAQQGDLVSLEGTRCLRLEGGFYRPDQVFWGAHPFGRFRKRLGETFRNFNSLLMALSIREMPDYTDAINVLEDISAELRHSPLGDDREAVMECWSLLTKALSNGDITNEELHDGLANTECVPNQQHILYKPSWMFFEDRPGLAEKFPQVLNTNAIQKPERVWPTMAAAGVRAISEVVTGEIIETSTAWEDSDLKQRLTSRLSLLKRITEGPEGSGLEGIEAEELRFVRCDDFMVVWHLSAFDKEYSTEPEHVTAHRLTDDVEIYFTLDRGEYPWTALAREIGFALAPNAEVRTISPGIKIVLETDDEDIAAEQLNDLGIAKIEIAPAQSTPSGSIVESFDENPELNESENVSDWTFDTSAAGNLTTGEQADPIGISNTDSIPKIINNEPEKSPSTPQGDRFVDRLFDGQSHQPPKAPDSDIVLPTLGPNTEESAKKDTEESFQSGRRGAHITKQVIKWEPSQAAKSLSDRFQRMAYGDYAKRCQICSKTFRARGGEHQVFVLHLVQPSMHRATNNYGDLLSLCGWHYALIQFGQWEFLDPETDSAIQDTDRLLEILLGAQNSTDDQGNDYVGISIRFYNVFEDRSHQATNVDEEIRYSLPHWTYLQQIFAAEERY